MAISKHLVSERGATYQLLKNGVGMTSLQLQKDILEAGNNSSNSSKASAKLLWIVEQRSQEMDAVNASTALHLLASMNTSCTGEVRSASQTLLRRVLEDQDPEPRALAISSWSAARLRLQEAAPLLALGEAIIAAEREFEGQDVANVTWGFATLKGSNYDEVLRCMAGRSLRNLRSFEPRHLSNVCWALATGRVGHGLFFEAAARAVGEQSKASSLHAFGSQDISNMLWAYATTKCITVSPLPTLADRAAKLGWDKFQPQELSICMWAAMTLGVADARPQVNAAVQRLLQHTARQIRKGGAASFEPRHMSNAAWALARWQRHCRLTGLPQECKAAVARPALRSLAQEAAGRLDAFAEHELVRLLWALGAEGCLHLRLLAKPLTATLSLPSSSSSSSSSFCSSSSASSSSSSASSSSSSAALSGSASAVPRLEKLDVEQLTTIATVLSWTLERAVWEPRVAKGQSALSTLPQERRPHEQRKPDSSQQGAQAPSLPPPAPPPPPPPPPPPSHPAALEGRLRDGDTRRRRRRKGN